MTTSSTLLRHQADEARRDQVSFEPRRSQSTAAVSPNCSMPILAGGDGAPPAPAARGAGRQHPSPPRRPGSAHRVDGSGTTAAVLPVIDVSLAAGRQVGDGVEGLVDARVPVLHQDADAIDAILAAREQIDEVVHGFETIVAVEGGHEPAVIPG